MCRAGKLRRMDVSRKRLSSCSMYRDGAAGSCPEGVVAGGEGVIIFNENSSLAQTQQKLQEMQYWKSGSTNWKASGIHIAERRHSYGSSSSSSSSSNNNM